MTTNETPHTVGQRNSMDRPNYLLRGVLLVLGAVVVVLGLNVGLGGIRTLGWQGGVVEFLTITDPAVFAVRDNHVRFIGGVWLGAGLLVAGGAFWLKQLRAVLVAIAAMVFVGGLSRLGALDPALLADMAIIPSLLFELIGFPLLGLWAWHAGRK